MCLLLITILSVLFMVRSTPQFYTLSLHDALPIFMDLRVECYSGHKADERPVRFRLNGHDYFVEDRKSTRLNSSHLGISYAVFCLKKKTCYRHHYCRHG